MSARVVVVALALAITLLAAPRAAYAFLGCVNEDGVAPRIGTHVQPHPYVVHYGRGAGHQKYTATIDGAAVEIHLVEMNAMDGMRMIEVKSERIGTLVIRFGSRELARYVVERTEPPPTEVRGVIGRYRQHLADDFVDDSFTGLGIWLPEGTPAIAAHVRLRAGATAPWTEIEVPVPSSEEQPRPVIRIGTLGCNANYPLGRLARGVDLQISVWLTNGVEVWVTGPAPHVTLPDPLPRPKPRRAR